MSVKRYLVLIPMQNGNHGRHLADYHTIKEAMDHANSILKGQPWVWDDKDKREVK